MAHFQNKLVAITGAASGIGLATAKKLASQGALLSIADINADALAHVSTILSDLHCSNNQQQQHHQNADASNGVSSTSSGTHKDRHVLATALDIRDAIVVESWIAETTTYFGKPLDAAANMAGIVGPSLGLPSGSIRNVAESEFQRVLEVNMHGTWNCLRAQLPAMRSSDSGGSSSSSSSSSIVNAASIAGIVGVENNAPYVMAKHAIVGLTKTAAKEEGWRNIRVNAIAPGIVDTPMVEGIKNAAGTTEQFGPGDPGAMKRKGTSEEVANLVCFLLGDESSFISGMVYGIDGGWIC
ncbi:MAG: hypothetical protein L6R41_001530 [Letrouitia leprolyta]|nr:MAG: hypothetical protein L6R41_001530 [Letrouitia leprolyta]